MVKRYILAAFFCAAMSSADAAGPYTDFNAGIAALKHGDADVALTHFNAALAAPDFNPAFRPAAYFDRGQIFASRKQWDAAIADFGAALAADPLYLDAYEARAGCYVVTGKFDLAAADLTALINHKPYFPRSYAMRGGIYVVQGRFDAAIADFTQAIAIAPDTPQFYAVRAQTYRAQNNVEKAIDDIDKAIDIDAQNASYLIDRAELYQLKSDYRRAAEDYRSAAALAPSDVVILLQQGIAEWAQSNLATADALFVKVRAASGDKSASYGALWVAIAANQGDAGKAAAANLPRDVWPGPILKLYFDGATIDQVLKAASVGDATTQKNQICEANFYGAEWYLQHGNTEAAKPMLAAAAANCPVDFVEHDAAAVALHKLEHP